jgi:PiT family inorganic phosphate transporter
VDVLVALTLFTVLAVVVFDFTNGFHDASNMLSTLVASRAMTPAQSVLLVGTFTVLGPILGGTAVANTIGGFVTVDGLATREALRMLLCGVSGAIGWNLLTWRWGLPSSSSHALVGGIAAAVVAGAGAGHVLWGGAALFRGELVGVTKVAVALLASPALGFGAGFLLHRGARRLLAGASPRINHALKRAQWGAAAALAFSHGTNDAQKGMGIITLVLVLTHHLDAFQVPLWVMVVSASSMTLGTTAGGWRIVKTVGYGLYRLRPLHGLNAELSSAAVIFGASLGGGPVSTTHVVTGSIMGVGASERPRAVRWLQAREIVAAWFLTVPGAGLISLLLWWCSSVGLRVAGGSG